MKLKPKELRVSTKDEEKVKKVKRNPIYIVLDNVMDTYNIGAIFRLADAVAAEKVLLCGETETPPNSRIKKASINTTEWIEWQYYELTVEAIKDLRQQFSPSHPKLDPDLIGIDLGSRKSAGVQVKPGMTSGIQIVAIEQNKQSIPYDQAEYKFPIALVVGHETHGVSKEVLSMCDKIVELPMFGVNVSLNVMVSLGISLYKVLEQIDKK